MGCGWVDCDVWKLIVVDWWLVWLSVGIWVWFLIGCGWKIWIWCVDYLFWVRCYWWYGVSIGLVVIDMCWIFGLFVVIVGYVVCWWLWWGGVVGIGCIVIVGEIWRVDLDFVIRYWGIRGVLVVDVVDVWGMVVFDCWVFGIDW